MQFAEVVCNRNNNIAMASIPNDTVTTAILITEFVFGKNVYCWIYHWKHFKTLPCYPWFNLFLCWVKVYLL